MHEYHMPVPSITHDDACPGGPQVTPTHSYAVPFPSSRRHAKKDGASKETRAEHTRGLGSMGPSMFRSPNPPSSNPKGRHLGGLALSGISSQMVRLRKITHRQIRVRTHHTPHINTGTAEYLYSEMAGRRFGCRKSWCVHCRRPIADVISLPRRVVQEAFPGRRPFPASPTHVERELRHINTCGRSGEKKLEPAACLFDFRTSRVNPPQPTGGLRVTSYLYYGVIPRSPWKRGPESLLERLRSSWRFAR